MEPVREELLRIVEGFGDNPPTTQEMAHPVSYLNEIEALANHESLA